MKTYDVKCPACGMVNRDLYLQETDCWMECAHCHEVTSVYRGRGAFRISDLSAGRTEIVLQKA